MARRCPARRLDSMAKIEQELTAWESVGNEDCGKAMRHFATAQARTELLSLYPDLNRLGI